MKCGRFSQLLDMPCLFGLQLWRLPYYQVFFCRSLVIRSVILAFVILLGSAGNVFAQRFNFEMPLTPQEFIDEKVKSTADPEVRTYVAALAGIMVIGLLIKK